MSDYKEVSPQWIDVIKRILIKLVGSTSWGLHPENGWSRPMVIDYKGEWYMLVNPNENRYFEEMYFDYSDDVKRGDYVPMGIKVGEEI